MMECAKIAVFLAVNHAKQVNRTFVNNVKGNLLLDKMVDVSVRKKIKR